MLATWTPYDKTNVAPKYFGKNNHDSAAENFQHTLNDQMVQLHDLIDKSHANPI